ncbi:sodium channel regulatory subunit beta-3-like isoform X2 [Oncorhynchus nerka]|uniref:sodium channel regulatory subunit beta-3-like isoform X2 n=1 Tax=Oncorhynchus nerka TaxID=8023 RepID=UPI0011324769|nr:sodium channel subunit beta-3-like isoform X2 [Oncorhynchus nerka]
MRLRSKIFQDPMDTDSLRTCPRQLSQRIPNMRSRTRVILHSLLLLVLVVQVSRPVCVDVPSETEAVVGNPMKLTCISCMKREEVNAETRVDWYYIPPDEEPISIYLFDGKPRDLEGPWRGRLMWNGSKDLQELSISILNVTMNDTGTYKCVVFRQFEFDCYSPSVTNSLIINLVVREEASEDTTALYSEIMMYVLLVFLTCWLLVEMVYCYRKISKSEEQAQDTAY